jgi:hypothetical protein
MRRSSIVLVLLLLSLVPGRGRSESGPISALYTRQTLSLTIPYHANRSGEADLRVQVLSPEGDVLGQSTQSMLVSEGRGAWSQEVALRQPMPLSEVIWQRVLFTLQYADEHTPVIEEIRSVSAILRRPVLHILGQRSHIAG